MLDKTNNRLDEAAQTQHGRLLGNKGGGREMGVRMHGKQASTTDARPIHNHTFFFSQNKQQIKCEHRTAQKQPKTITHRQC